MRDSLVKLKKRQVALKKVVKRDAEDKQELLKKVNEIQNWTYMMNTKFNSAKKPLNPLRWLLGKRK